MSDFVGQCALADLQINNINSNACRHCIIMLTQRTSTDHTHTLPVPHSGSFEAPRFASSVSWGQKVANIEI